MMIAPHGSSSTIGSTFIGEASVPANITFPFEAIEIPPARARRVPGFTKRISCGDEPDPRDGAERIGDAGVCAFLATLPGPSPV